MRESSRLQAESSLPVHSLIRSFHATSFHFISVHLNQSLPLITFHSIPDPTANIQPATHNIKHTSHNRQQVNNNQQINAPKDQQHTTNINTMRQPTTYKKQHRTAAFDTLCYAWQGAVVENFRNATLGCQSRWTRRAFFRAAHWHT